MAVISLMRIVYEWEWSRWVVQHELDALLYLIIAKSMQLLLHHYNHRHQSTEATRLTVKIDCSANSRSLVYFAQLPLHSISVSPQTPPSIQSIPMTHPHPHPTRKPFFSIIKPRPLFRPALNRYDNSVFATTEQQYLIDHFNYGFHPDTMEAYSKLVKRMAREEDRTNVEYDPSALGQVRFNDDIPIDLGGLAPFLEKGEVEKDLEKNDTLVKCLIWAGVKASTRQGCKRQKEQKELYYLNEYLKELYQTGSELPDIMKQLENSIEQRYERLMQKQAAINRPSPDRKPHIQPTIVRDKPAITPVVMPKKEEEVSEDEDMCKREESPRREVKVKKEDRVKKEEETHSDHQDRESSSARRRRKEKKQKRHKKKEMKEKEERRAKKERKERRQRKRRQRHRHSSQQMRELDQRNQKTSRQFKYRKQRSPSQQQEVQYRQNASSQPKRQKSSHARDNPTRRKRERRSRSSSSSSSSNRR